MAAEVTYTSAELAEVRAARSFIHSTACPVRGGESCAACPSGLGLLMAIRALRAAPRDARAARRALHDAACRSGCGPESDHADRTQRAPAASLRKFLAQVAHA